MSSAARSVSPYVALVSVLVGVFIAADDQTVIVTVLPQIMLDMRVPVTELDKASWTVTGYLLGYLVAMPLIGRVSDVWGRRQVFFAAMAVFMAGSVAVAVVPDLESMLPFELPPGAEFPDFEILIAARVFQAIGAGALVPVAIAIAGDLFPAGRRGLPLGLIGASAEAGGVIGPLWGGLVPQQMDRLWNAIWSNAPVAQGLAEWLNQEQGWRWVFWINIPLSLVVLALVIWLLPTSPRTAARVDYVGGALIAASLAAMTLGLARIGEPDALMVGYLLLSAVALGLFIRRQLSHPQPLLPMSVFRGAAFGAASGTHVFVGAALIIGMVTLPLMANTVMGLTPLDGGLWLMRMTAAMPVGAIVGGLACQRWDYRVPTAAGLVLAAVGFALMAGWDTNIRDPALTVHLVIAGLGFGLLIAPISLAATDSVEEGARGGAAGIVTATRIVGMTLGLAALTAWGSDRFTGLAAHIALPLPVVGETSAEYQRRVDQFDAELSGVGVTIFNEFFVVAAALCLAALIPAAWMAWSRRRSQVLEG